MKKYSFQDDQISLVNEPEVFYALENKFSRIMGVLGGLSQVGQTVNSDIDLIDATRKGLPKSVLATISAVLGISMEKMSSLLHVSYRTIQRKKDEDLLNVYTTGQLFEIARVVSHGIAVFETLDGFKKWLHTEIRALNHKKPIAFFDTGFGLNLIDNTLGRIEHGVY
ncbi:MAG: type II toxin-antitoxin system Xre/ParS family antitoxin [Marinirhabdus sp.]